MAHHKFETQARCQACRATGLYVGMAERDGAAVVCHRCKGTGEVTLTLEWDDFEGRATRSDVKRVYETNPGIVVGTGNIGQFDLSEFGGIPYDDWQRGEPFPVGSEMRQFACPAWWYQCADYDKKPDWDECRDSLGRSFSKCPHFRGKAKCWARFDKESPE